MPTTDAENATVSGFSLLDYDGNRALASDEPAGAGHAVPARLDHGGSGSLNADEEERKSIIEALMPFAREAKGKLSFTWVDATKYAQHVQNLGVSGVAVSAQIRTWTVCVRRHHRDSGQKFFFEAYATGTLEAHFKSEPMPESNDEHVYVLVGSEFEESQRGLVLPAVV